MRSSKRCSDSRRADTLAMMFASLQWKLAQWAYSWYGGEAIGQGRAVALPDASAEALIGHTAGWLQPFRACCSGRHRAAEFRRTIVFSSHFPSQWLKSVDFPTPAQASR